MDKSPAHVLDSGGFIKPNDEKKASGMKVGEHVEVLVITGSSFRAKGRQQLEQEVPVAQPAWS